VDAAIVDGTPALMTMFYGMRAAGLWNDRRQDNLLDGGAHFYDIYETEDHKFVCIGLWSRSSMRFYSRLPG